MNTQEINSLRTGDKYYKIKHPSGLTIFVYPKEGYSSAYAIFGTKYGSVNTCFSVDGGEKITVPDGIAHYLEHKLFESEDLDAFERYAKTGASANAYTSFDKTCYLFSCSDNFEKNLEILLDFVQSPYFTAETVAKEQGIIGQEIKMYDDSPDWKVMFNLLECLYHTHPVKIDIAGTVESIAEITAEKLYTVYNTFYNLNNMVLCVAGNVTTEQVLSVADKMLKANESHKLTNYFEPEPYQIVKPYVEQKMAVSLPLFNLGFKEKAGEVMACAHESAETDILLTMLFSPSGELYSSLLKENLVNDTFSYEVFEGPGYYSILLGGESRNPEKAAEMIKEYIAKIKQKGISEDDFDRAKKACYGENIAALNSVEGIANSLVGGYFAGRDYFEYIDALADAEFEAVKKRFTEILNVDNCALSVIKGE